MKKFIGISFFAVLIGFSSAANAQEKEKAVEQEVKEIGKDVKKGAKKAGNKTAEVASKGKAKITDQVYKDKVGPNGATVYIDNHSKYYWIDKKGRKQFVTEAELKDKPKDE